MGIYTSGFPILSLITYVPLIGAILLAFFPRDNGKAIKYFATAVAGFDFLLSIPLWIYFNPNGTGSHMFQFRETYQWIPSLGVDYSFGIDGIALLLLLMTTLFGVIAIYSSF